MFHEIIYTATNFNHYVKEHHRLRMQTKYTWLLRKYYDIGKQHRPPYQPRDHIPPQQRVTVLRYGDGKTVLNEDEISVLSLGRGYAITPSGNERLFEVVEVNLSKTSYKLNWEMKNSERPANIIQDLSLSFNFIF